MGNISVPCIMPCEGRVRPRNPHPWEPAPEPLNWAFPRPPGVPVPPLPDSMRFLGSGWWWIHVFSAVGVFCFGWYVGQNRAERHYGKLVKEAREARDREGA